VERKIYLYENKKSKEEDKELEFLLHTSASIHEVLEKGPYWQPQAKQSDP
jgi:hypothetical protein